MNDLRRELAPITAEAWAAVDDEARRTLTTYLAARKIVDFVGPKGWGHAAVPTGRAVQIEAAPLEDVQARLREVLPLVELRVPFDLSRDELDSVGRGATNPELGPLVEAARRIALAEDRAVLEGYEPAHIRGVLPSAPRTLRVGGGEELPRVVSEALEVLREAGVGGPYAVALGPRWYTELSKIPGPGKYPLMEHVRRLIEGPIVWAPALTGGVVVSLRGGDFQLTVGRDISIGYLEHDATRVRLYFEESLSARVLTAEAAVPLAS